MTLGELLDALAARATRVAANGERLRHVGPRFADGEPVRRALATFHDEIVHLVTNRRLCCFCPRLLAVGDLIACTEHRVMIEETPMPWEQANTIASGETEPCRNINGVCQDQKHAHVGFDEFLDDYRAQH